MTTPRTPQDHPGSPEQDEQEEHPVTEAPRTPAPRVAEHDELLRPNPPFPGDAPD